MKTFQNPILNSVLGWVAISALVSGCNITSLRSSLSKDSSRSSTSSATNTTPTLPSYGGSGDGYSGGKKGDSKKGDLYGDGGYGSGISSDFGGHSSKKQSQQKTSWSDPYPSDYPSQNSSGHHSGSWGNSGGDDSWGDDGGYPNQGPDHSGNSGNSGYPSYPGNSAGNSAGNSPDAGAGERNQVRNTHAAAEAATASSHLAAHSPSSSPSHSQSETSRVIGESCSGVQGSQGICLALKYVSYEDGYGDDVESEKDAVRDVGYANQIWRDCGIQFQLEDYQSVQPQSYDLRYRTRNYEELNQIRGTFSDENKLLVVATGKWDRSGSLGSTWANAWTNLPGERTYGVVLERTVTSYPQILAHELGHYLSLDHKNDPNSLMNPVVARQSVELSRQECRAARWAAQAYWREMMR